MSKHTSTPRRESRNGASRFQAARLPSGSLPLRKTWPISLCVGLAIGSIAFSGEALAGGPTGGVVVGGSGNIAQSGNQTVINQISQRLALNWDTFNLKSNESVLFNQPSRSAVALNRILDQNPSQIFGKINSNGQVFLINTHGIIFGATAQMNVGGLMASTLDLTPKDFLAGNYNLNVVGGGAGIVNHGLIQASSGGSISLIGGSVLNDGLILANYGTINLDGADHAVLDFDGNGLINIQITGELKQRLDAREAAVTNKGTLQADGGTVVLQASAARDLFTSLVNNSGVIDASGISTDGGVVRLVGNGGNVENSGSIDVSGVHGGTAQLLSDQNVGITGSIDASGTHGGGNIRVGGGWQGGEGLQTAAVTYVGSEAKLNADATQSGNGGSVVVWGNNGNNFFGNISARGGVIGGNGGQVETSAHNGLNVQGQVDASAPSGNAGTWLLDPWNVSIVTSGGTLTSPFTATADSSINASAINGALTGTNVFVFTGSTGTSNGDITVNAPISATSGANNALYLEAAGSIFLNAGISSDGTNALQVNLWANYGGAAAGTTYSSNASCVLSCVVTVGNTASAAITTSGGNVDIETGTGGGAVSIGNGANIGSINTGGGTLTVNATGIAEGSAGSIAAGAATFNAGAGVITLDNTSNNFTGAVSLNNSGANNVTLNNGTNALSLGISAVGTGTLTVNGKGITQTGAITQAASAGMATFNAGAGPIALGNVGNNFSGVVSLSNSGASAVNLNNGGHALALGTVNVGSGAFTLSNYNNTLALDGNITTSGSAISLGGAGGTVSLGVPSITIDTTGASTVAAGANIGFLGTLDGASNLILTAGTGGAASFGGTVGAATPLTSLTTNAGGGTTLVGNVHTTGAQTYNNAVTLGGNDTLAGTTVSLAGGVTGAGNSLTITGNTTLGTANGLSALTVSGTSLLNGNVTTTGTQTYTGAVTLGGNDTLAGTNVSLAGGVTGANNSLTITGNTTLGTASGLSALTVSGTSLLNGSVTTTGTQTYTGAVTLGGNDTLAGTTVSLAGGVTGANNSLTITGNTTLGTASGLSALTVSGTSLLNGSVTTTGTQTYTGAVTLGGNDTLAGTNVSLAGGVTGAGNSLTITGNTTLGTASGLSALTVSGTSLLNGSVTTTGAQTYNGAVLLGSGIALQATNGNVGFGSTVDNAGATAEALTVNAANGLVSFAGAVGGGSNGALSGLTTNSKTFSANALNIGSGGLSVTTTGGGIGQGGGAFTVTGTSFFSAGGGALALTNGNNDFTGAVTATGTGVSIFDKNNLDVAGVTDNGNGNVNLTAGGTLTLPASAINAGTGALTLVSNGGSLATSGALSGGTVSLTGSGGITLAGSVTASNTLQLASANTPISQTAGILTVSSTTSVGAGSGAITLNGPNAFTGAVSLTGGTTQITNSGALKLGSLSTGALTATSLVGGVNLGQGTVGGALVATAAGDITETGALGVSGASSFTVTGGQHDILLNTITTPNNFGGQTVTVNASGGGSIGTLSLSDSNAAALFPTLTVAPTNLVLDYTQAGIAVTSPLTLGGTLDLAAGAGITLNGSVTTGGAQTYRSAVLLGGASTLTASNGNVSFGGAVDNAGATQEALTVNAANGLVSFGSALGGGANGALASLITNSGSFSANALNIGSGGLSVTTTSGGIAQGTGVFTVTGPSTFTAVGQSISLTNNNVFGGTVTASGTGIAITAAGDLAIASLTNGANGAVSLIAGGNLILSGAAIDTGASDLTLTSGGTLTTTSAMSGADVYLTGTSGLSLGSNVTATTTLGLHSSNGSINQTAGVLTAGTLTGNSAGGTTLGGDNAIANLGAFNANGFSLTNAQALAVNGAVAGGTGATTLTTTAGNNLTLAATGSVAGSGVTLSSGGAIDAIAGSSVNSNNGALSLNGGAFTLDGALNAGTGTATLNATGAIAQAAATGVITAGTLTGHSTGSTSLLGANKVGTLGAFNATNGFSLTNAQALAANGAVAGGTGATTLTTTAGNNLTLAATGSVAGSGVTLSSGGAIDAIAGSSVNSNNGALSLNGGAFTLDGALNAGTGTATLNATGAIAQAAATGVITAGTLTGHSTGSTSLLGANKIGTLGAFNATNGFSLVDAQALAVNGAVAGGTGATTLTTSGAGNNLTLTSAGNITGTGVTLTSGGTLDAAAGSSVNSSNGALSLTGGAFTLDGALNAGTGTATLAANGAIAQAATGVITAGTLTGHSTGSTSLLGANKVGTLGAFTTGGDFAFNDAQSLAVNTALSANGGAGNITLTTIGAGSDLVLASGLTGNTVTLKAGRNLAQTAGVIKANTLTGSAAGSASLNDANLIGTLGSFSSNGFSLTNAQALAVNGAVAGGTGATTLTTSGAGNNLTLAATGSVAGSGVTLSSGGAIDVIAGSRVNSNNGALSLNGGAFALDGALNAGTGTVTLTSSGAISQAAATGVITAGTLTGQAVGSTDLNGANLITTLGSFTSDFSLTNAQTLTVAGPLNGGPVVTLTTTAGDLIINGAVNGTATTLNSAGAISEGVAGVITADTLSGHSAGATSLNGANRIGALGSFSAANFALTNAQTLAVSGPINGGASTTLTTTAGDLAINGAVNGTTMTLKSAGAINEGAGGSLTASNLSGQSAGATSLNGANHIGTLGSFSAAAFALTNAQSLAVTGPINGGSSAALTTTAGDLAINGAVNGTTTTLKSAGAISEGAGGSITAGNLSGQSAGATSLNSANHIGTLGSFSAAAFALTNAQSLAVTGPVNGGSSAALTTTAGDLAINGTVNGATTTLKSAGAISEGAGGSITASNLSGQSAGATSLNGTNHIGTLGSFSAANFALTNAQSLAVTGPVNGGASTVLTTTAGGLAINGAVSGTATTLNSAGAITEGAGGVITAGTLSGTAAGATVLGSASSRNANMVDTLGNFTSLAGFSMTNDKTLTLASVGGSAFTVNAGTSAFYLSVTNGDLFQLGTAQVYDGLGVWGSTGRMGTASNPIYVIGTGLQSIANVGLPPAYFYALDSSGNLLPLGGGFAINVPTASGAGSAQNGNHGDSYIDPSVITANYRSYGIVPSGVRLPADQQNGCDPDQPDQSDCQDPDSVGMVLAWPNSPR
ncbi:filamentous hemagglutinin N-terminal domain-containing protein [Rhodanobacter sp. B05]|uniref:filamentous hemagglutinin N-terminal domain-containing protein n=1 Tax=Rhodanobacter sp. B05 TaxID=1945859 RepID=UPI0014388366|nr:filamentous hemagglutinin N-terminal domain-containing protein [Rhodanobacter sp. B05]